MSTENESYRSRPASRPTRERSQYRDARVESYSRNRVMVEDSSRFATNRSKSFAESQENLATQKSSAAQPARQRQNRDIVEAAGEIGYWGHSSASLEFERRRTSASQSAQVARRSAGDSRSANRNRANSVQKTRTRKPSQGSQKRDRYATNVQQNLRVKESFKTKDSAGRSRLGGKRSSLFAGRSRISSAGRLSTKDMVVRAVVIALIIVVVIFAITRISSCASKASNQATSQTTTTEQTAAPAVSEELLKQVNAVDLSGILEDTEITAIKDKAQTNEDVAWIVANSNKYEQYGTEVHAKLFRLVLNDTNSINFVRYYPDKVGTDAVGSETLTNRTVPMPFYYQWDTAWGYMNYGDSSLGMNGCGPTCMAMIASAILGDSSINPYTMAKLIIEHGYVTEGDGTDADVFPVLATLLGFYGNETYNNYNTIKNALDNGEYLILNVGPGDFTRGGHFIVVEKLNENGTVVVHDPYSTVNSSKRWDLESVVDQTKRVFVFS